MFLRRHRDSLSWLQAAGPLLEAQRLRLSLLKSVAKRHRNTADCYWATVHDGKADCVALALRTPPYKVLLSELGTAANLVAEDLHCFSPELPGAMGPAGSIDAFARAWERQAGARSFAGEAQLLYALSELIPPKPRPGKLRRAKPWEGSTLLPWVRGFQNEVATAIPGKPEDIIAHHLRNESLWVWDEGAPVAMAAGSQESARIGLVYTPPELRGLGRASNLVGALSSHLLEASPTITLFAEATNPGSNAIYQRLGYTLVDRYADVVFRSPAPNCSRAL